MGGDHCEFKIKEIFSSIDIALIELEKYRKIAGHQEEDEWGNKYFIVTKEIS